MTRLLELIAIPNERIALLINAAVITLLAVKTFVKKKDFLWGQFKIRNKYSSRILNLNQLNI